ncbi:hypothetical protein BDU57DRAFT_58398 [Ampelomyces quisqualis]|uniref:Uncharacterized protein n=1 Tax=Ampelomyces quisqualis TaxID=50730 RepID=A0A6A5R1X5_AMPQU|nr:hypothetical protein BDU57DRAFT_58398 [Ampelomyces quisqualis]
MPIKLALPKRTLTMFSCSNALVGAMSKLASGARACLNILFALRRLLFFTYCLRSPITLRKILSTWICLFQRRPRVKHSHSNPAVRIRRFRSILELRVRFRPTFSFSRFKAVVLLVVGRYCVRDGSREDSLAGGPGHDSDVQRPATQAGPHHAPITV